MTGSLRRYFDTLRHLPPRQIVWRLRRRLLPRRPAPPIAIPALATTKGAWVKPIAPSNPLIAPRRLVLLGETIDLDSEGWAAPSRSALVQYNLHYLDCLRAAGGADHQQWCHSLIRDWIARNPAGTPIAWDPYPISLRLVNLIKFALISGEFSAQLAASVAHQAQWLAENLEHDIRANHLFANAKALAIAGMALDGPLAEGWRALGCSLVHSEVGEQQLADGAHFERSPMYHALFTEDLLDLVNFARRTGHPGFAETMAPHAAAALSWLGTMVHPDGEIAFFNDAAFDIAPSHAHITQYASRLGIASTNRPTKPGYSPSGYVRFDTGAAVLIADLAELGPDYQPGHGHADTLSFELSLGGDRLVVNSGTSVYGSGEERQRQRGTAAHSTLQLEGMDSSEVWAGFRVGRRAQVKCECLTPDRVTGSHNGYRFLRGVPRHRRSWRLQGDELTVEDFVTPETRDRAAWNAVVRFHLHPDIAVHPEQDSIKLITPSGMAVVVTANRPITVDQGSWHPRFGQSIANSHLAIRWRAKAHEPGLVTRFSWASAS